MIWGKENPQPEEGKGEEKLKETSNEEQKEEETKAKTDQQRV